MATFKDKKLELGELLDTNINVFTFGSLLLNGAYGFGGVKMFTNEKVLSSSNFQREVFEGEGDFTKTKVVSSSSFEDKEVGTSTNFTNVTTNG
jgi:hypothetical protein